ncbi:hypothetical protein [Clostridium septicum]|nr:hypothetical protein [Clostridium septicum]
MIINFNINIAFKAPKIGEVLQSINVETSDVLMSSNYRTYKVL